LLRLRELISQKINIDLDGFKLFRAQYTTKIELRDESESLKNLNIYTGQKLTVERGKPLRQGEMNIKFSYFDPNANKQIIPLFQHAIPGKLSVAVAKEAVFAHFNELQADPTKKLKDDITLCLPHQLRLREVRGISPGKIFLDTNTVKDMCQGLVFTSPDILVQKVLEGEVKTSRDTIVIFLQQWCPSTWTLGPRFEFTTEDDEKLSTFRDRLCERTGIASIALASASGWEGPDVLSLPNLKWNVPASGLDEGKQSGNAYIHNLKGTVRSLILADGDLLLFKDTTEELKELTPEEKKEKKTADTKRRVAIHAIRWPSSRDESEAQLVIKDGSKDIKL